MNVQPVPAGFTTITPYITVPGANAFIRFMQKAFGAKIVGRTDGADGSVVNAEIRIGNAMIMVSEGSRGYGPRPGTIYLYVEKTDELYHRALAAGAKSLMEPANQFYGDRSAGVEDPFGNHWWIATHIENVTPEEIARRAASLGR